jgi:citrate lyase subunit alpha/citrate CoA-transferase
MSVEFVVNKVGRRIPTVVNGREQTPFLGVGAYEPEGRKQAPPIRSCRDYPPNGDKRVPDLKSALRNCGITDGMTISTHHHLRNGDAVALLALRAAAELGIKDLMWFPSAGDRTHGSRGRSPHRGQHERPARRVLLARQDAGDGRAALTRWPLAGDPGR